MKVSEKSFKKGRYLITTAIESTWPINEPVIFLGEWCRLFNRKHIWEGKDSILVPYHWDDREKLYKDYLFLSELHEELLLELSLKLNEIHHTNHSLRYWRILIGPWLGYFSQIIFDRYAMIERAASEYEISGVLLLENDTLENMAPNDMREFNSLHISDAWNEAIYGQLLSKFNDIPIKKVPNKEAKVRMEVTGENNDNKKFRNQISTSIQTLFGLFGAKDKIFLLSSYLPLKIDLLLQAVIGQIPKVWRTFLPPKVNIQPLQRQWDLKKKEDKGFQQIIRSLIPLHIPKIYLEGFNNMQGLIEAMKWPKNPHIIFTSNSFLFDDVFKFWAAGKVENGSKLIIGQHGGTYGTARWVFTEDHQVRISDKWISWGWRVINNPKIIPFGNLKTIQHSQKWDRNGMALMVSTSFPRYSYHMYSVPVASQWLEYFSCQTRFVEALPQHIQECLLIRLAKEDYSWCQKDRWKEIFPKVKLDTGYNKLSSLIRKSRLYISTYNATTYLESLFWNIPTIIYWDPNYWELREDAVPYFATLKKAGVFHDTPESAAQKVSEIWNDVSGWWAQPAIQETRKIFCDQYSRSVENPIDRLKNILNH